MRSLRLRHPPAPPRSRARIKAIDSQMARAGFGLLLHRPRARRHAGTACEAPDAAPEHRGNHKTHSLILPDHAPQTGLEAKFSMEFAMGAAVIARRASLG